MFAAAEASESTEKNESTRSSAAKTDVMEGLEDLFKPAPPMNDSIAVSQPQSQAHVPVQPQSQHRLPADAKKDIMSLFEKVINIMR